MTPTDMEEHLERLDQRLASVEQILPALATKGDLDRFATKDDLAQLEARQRAFTESVIDRMNTLFDGLDSRVTGVETETRGIRHILDSLVQRLEDRNVI